MNRMKERGKGKRKGKNFSNRFHRGGDELSARTPLHRERPNDEETSDPLVAIEEAWNWIWLMIEEEEKAQTSDKGQRYVLSS